VVIDDTYNANPASTRAAIAALAQHAGKTILVLGDMLDLGDQAVPAHAEIGRYVSECGISALYTCGDFAAHTAQACGGSARHFSKQGDLLAVLSDALAPGVTVLVKGSRAMGMEYIVSVLLEEKR
jgi:UDP-N-acetylmuramoyl-tripeptide--D-alanyl-D-alanine ligase